MFIFLRSFSLHYTTALGLSVFFKALTQIKALQKNVSSARFDHDVRHMIKNKSLHRVRFIEPRVEKQLSSLSDAEDVKFLS